MEQFGFEVKDSPAPLHLIYRIDLSDPLVSIEFPGVDFLPLLYCHIFAGQCSYVVEPENSVKLLCPHEPELFHPEWEGPDAFPFSRTMLVRQKYDATVAEDALALKGVFDWNELSQSEKDRALELAKGISQLTLEDAIDESWTYETVIDCMYEPPLVQGDPLERCQNKACVNFENDDSPWLKIIAIQDDATDQEQIWPDGAHVQVIWLMCPDCQSITVLNRCT